MPGVFTLSARFGVYYWVLILVSIATVGIAGCGAMAALPTGSNGSNRDGNQKITVYLMAEGISVVVLFYALIRTTIYRADCNGNYNLNPCNDLRWCCVKGSSVASCPWSCPFNVPPILQQDLRPDPDFSLVHLLIILLFVFTAVQITILLQIANTRTIRVNVEHVRDTVNIGMKPVTKWFNKTVKDSRKGLSSLRTNVKRWNTLKIE